LIKEPKSIEKWRMNLSENRKKDFHVNMVQNISNNLHFHLNVVYVDLTQPVSHVLNLIIVALNAIKQSRCFAYAVDVD
jgi:hypothetical protein